MQISSFFTKWRINGEPEVSERRGFDVEVAGALLYLVVCRLLPWDENSGVHNGKRQDLYIRRLDGPEVESVLTSSGIFEVGRVKVGVRVGVKVNV